jgi:hypothetical protein
VQLKAARPRTRKSRLAEQPEAPKPKKAALPKHRKPGLVKPA